MNAFEIQDLYNKQKAYFNSGATRSYEFRRKQLVLLKQIIKQNEQAILDALALDMHKPAFEAFLSEIGFVYEEINLTLSNLKSWMKPKSVATPVALQLSSSYIYKDPLGLTLIIGPWNYPFQLIFAPLIGAIAGGNCAIVKPSEFTTHTTNLIAKLIRENFDEAYISVVLGDGHIMGPLLIENHHFNLIFFTGSTAVGKEIMRLAAKQLSPVVLELGGKSPAIVAEDANISLAAKQLVWAKFFNAGQTCVSPDYVLVHHTKKAKLIDEMISHIQEFYGDNPLNSSDYTHIVNQNRFNKLLAYLKDVHIVYGGKSNEVDFCIEPTIVDEIPPNHALLHDEIFGPVFPVLTYQTKEEVIEIVSKNPYPLSCYIFTNHSSFEKYLLERIQFGGGCINNALVHLANPHLPFGGISSSGIGNYHGQYSFDVFTHQKSILKTSNLIDPPLRYPIYTAIKMKLAKLLFR
jgi:aldehyde dehydrogenase (NAD+)